MPYSKTAPQVSNRLRQLQETESQGKRHIHVPGTNCGRGDSSVLQHLLTIAPQCDETRPNCQKCQMYEVPCDYSRVEVQFGRSTDSSPVQRVSNIRGAESTMLLRPLSDLGARIDQALRLAPSSDEWSGTSRYGHSMTLKAFHHFVTVVSHDPTIPKLVNEVLQSDIVRLAFEVCMKSSWQFTVGLNVLII